MTDYVFQLGLRLTDWLRGRGEVFLLWNNSPSFQQRAVIPDGFLPIQVNYFEILNVKEVLFVHYLQNLRHKLFWCPDKNNSFGHELCGLNLQLLKILKSLTFLTPLDVNKKRLNVLGDVFKLLTDNVLWYFLFGERGYFDIWVVDIRVCDDF